MGEAIFLNRWPIENVVVHLVWWRGVGEGAQVCVCVCVTLRGSRPGERGPVPLRSGCKRAPRHTLLGRYRSASAPVLRLARARAWPLARSLFHPRGCVCVRSWREARQWWGSRARRGLVLVAPPPLSAGGTESQSVEIWQERERGHSGATNNLPGRSFGVEATSSSLSLRDSPCCVKRKLPCGDGESHHSVRVSWRPPPPLSSTHARFLRKVFECGHCLPEPYWPGPLPPFPSPLGESIHLRRPRGYYPAGYRPSLNQGACNLALLLTTHNTLLEQVTCSLRGISPWPGWDPTSERHAAMRVNRPSSCFVTPASPSVSITRRDVISAPDLFGRWGCAN